jgi:hypothetical protein
MLQFLLSAFMFNLTPSVCIVDIFGEINSVTYDKISNLECKEIVVTVNSIGGKEEISLDVAEIISNKNATIVVEDYCLSACAEFILPAAKKIVFQNYSIVGFHGNPVITEKYININRPDGSQFCNFESAVRMRKLYRKWNANIDFWKLQIGYLVAEKLLINPHRESGECPKVQLKFENDLFIADSKQLEILMGRKFDGAVCADSYETCKKKIARYLSQGKYVVGDRVFKW